MQNLKSLLEKTFELLQFLIDGNSERLKNLRRRMVVAPRPSLHCLNNLNKFLACLNRPSSPFIDDRARQPARVRLLAIVAKNSLQLIGGAGVDDLAGIQGLAAIHAHIEPCRGAEAEAPFGSIDLMRRNP